MNLFGVPATNAEIYFAPYTDTNILVEVDEKMKTAFVLIATNYF